MSLKSKWMHLSQDRLRGLSVQSLAFWTVDQVCEDISLATALGDAFGSSAYPELGHRFSLNCISCKYVHMLCYLKDFPSFSSQYFTDVMIDSYKLCLALLGGKYQFSVAFL